MKYQAVFKRYEIKYLITKEQKERLLEIYGTTNHLIAFYPVAGIFLLATMFTICAINMTFKKAAEH